MTETETPIVPTPDQAPADPEPTPIPEFDFPEYIPLVIQIDIVGQKFTDVWNADRFCDRFEGIVRYCNPKEMYYIWNGLLWEPDRYGRIRELCRMHLADLISDHTALAQADLLKHLVKSHTPSGIRGMMFFLEANRLTVREEELDSDPDRINVLNGVMNLKSVEYEAPNRDRFITRRMNVNYAPCADCPLWREHLSLIFGGDQETIDSFQMIAGYALLRQNPEQLFFILYGRGENGKSVTLNVLSNIMGEYCTNADPRTFMFRRTDDNSVRSDIARLYSSHMVTAIESSEGGRLNEGLLKAITGHDKITSRELYEKEQERYLEAKIFFATNHEPVIKDSTHGMLRRLIKIPFAVQIPIDKRDDQIETRLIAEASGILNWLLDGLRAWNENGKKIKLSKVITDSTAAFRNTIDENREFFNDDVEITGAVSDTISKRDLFQYYEQWYNDKHGEYPSIKLQAFNKICQEHNITRDLRTKTGWIWIGVKHLTYDYKEKVRKEKEEREQEQEQKRKLTIDEIAHAVLNKKGVGEIDEIFNVHIQKGERVNPDEPHLVKYQNVFSIRGLGDKVHQGSPVHPVDVNTSNVHMQKGEPNNHKEPSSPGFVCSSSCGPAERSNCKSNPALCGRGIPS